MQARIGGPSRVPQLTPAPLATTSPSFHGAAGHELLAGLHEYSGDEDGKIGYDSSAFLPESDHR